MALDQLYRDVVLDHNRWPRNFKRLAGATHAARGQDASCGDDLLMEIRAEGDVVVAAAFSGDACAVTQAAASLLTVWLPGRTLDEVRLGLDRFTSLLHHPDAPRDALLEDLNELQPVGAFPARRRNALLPWRTVVKALDAGTLPV